MTQSDADGFDAAEIARLRDDTPGCATRLHFNNAGSSFSPLPVQEAALGYLRREQEIGGYETVAERADDLKRFYGAFAELLRCAPEEIAYVENATRAWDMAFYALPLREGDRVITHESEYVSNYLAFLHQAQRRGLEIDIAPSDASGQIDVDALPGLITPQTKLIAITHAPTQGGLVNPAAEVGRVAKAHGLWFLLDACQSTGQVDIDVAEIGCHMLSGTGRKYLRGPRGTGFLYVASDIVERLDPPFVDLASARWTSEQSFEFAPGARRFENWESFFAGRVGLAKAVDYALAIGMDRIERRVRRLGETLRAALAEVPSITVRDRGAQRSGIVTFTSDRVSDQTVFQALQARAINVSVSPQNYARLDLGRRGLGSLVRASVHYFNTEDEIDRFCVELRQIVGS